VNAVNPTVVMTEMARRLRSDPVAAQSMMNRIPLAKFAGYFYITSHSQSVCLSVWLSLCLSVMQDLLYYVPAPNRRGIKR